MLGAMSAAPTRVLALLKPTAIAIAVSMTLAGCGSDDGGSQLQSGTVTTGEVTTTEASSTTVAPTTSPPETTTTEPPGPGSEDAQSYKAMAASLATLGEGVQAYVATVDGGRIDELAGSACSTVSPDMDDTQLGAAGLAAYRELSDQEQAGVAVNDWVVFYGSLIGFFCPDRLPTIEDASEVPADGSEVAQFLALIDEIAGVSAEAENFVASLTEDRLVELHTVACASVTVDMTTEDFGRAIVDSYGADLTEAERAQIGLSGYSEFYGALVGWFCPDKLPL